MRPNPERIRKLRAKQFGEHRDFIVRLRCCNCLKPGPSHPHHVKTRAAGGTYRDLVPLCHTCHRTVHTVGIEKFRQVMGIDLQILAESLWMASPANRNPPDPEESEGF